MEKYYLKKKFYMNNIIIHIGARSNSRGLENKNIMRFLGKPLILWSIEMAKRIKPKIGIIVNTDSSEIEKIAKKANVDFILKRPKSLSNSKASKFSAWQFACKYLIKEKIININDIFLDFDCTCPLRIKSDIENLIKKFLNYKKNKIIFDAVFTVTEARRNPYFNIMEKKGRYFKLSKKLKKKIIRRQDAPEVFEHCGVGYAIKPSFLINKKNFLDGKLIGHKINFKNSLDIDNKLDFQIAEYIKKNVK